MRLSRRKYSSPTQHWSQRHPSVLLTLIVANLLIFGGQWVLENFQPGFITAYLGISQHGISDAYAWQFVTALFLYGGPWHLAANILILCLFGRDLETILGQRHFLYLYLSGAVGGELSHLFLMPNESVLFAASGGVAAVLFAYAIILPELELTTLFTSRQRITAKHLGYGIVILAAVLLCFDRQPVVWHSALLGGAAGGWLYAHLLGFGRTSFLQRFLRQRRIEAERYEQMSAEELIAIEVDPLLEKISQHGLVRLTRSERRTLLKAREKLLQRNDSN
jgi:membrane associated rhomboid family serine protease